jgi:hypothetical protein
MIDAAARDDKRLEAVGAEIREQLNHRLIDKFGIRPFEARMPRRGDPIRDDPGELFGGHADMCRRNNLH